MTSAIQVHSTVPFKPVSRYCSSLNSFSHFNSTTAYKVVHITAVINHVFRLFFCCSIDSKRTYDNVLQSSTVPADYNSGNHYNARCAPRIPTEEWKTCSCQTQWVFLHVYLWLPYYCLNFVFTNCGLDMTMTIKWFQGCDSCVKRMFSSLQGFVLGLLRIALTKINLVHQARWNVLVFLVTSLKTDVAAPSKKLPKT